MRNSVLTALFLLAIACENKRPVTNKIHLGIYGRPKTRIEVRVDGQVIYEKDTNVTKLLEVDRGPITVHKDQADFFLSVDSKDTLFTYPLLKNNYFLFGYSDIRKEFQFTVYDSVHFFYPRD